YETRDNKEVGATIGTDGTVGKETWGAFFDVYRRYLEDLMQADGLSLADARGNLKYLPPETAGCGENFPLTADKKENFRSATDRRVEIAFFDPGEEPKMDCPPGHAHPH